MNNVRFSIVLCSFNGAATLPRTIAALNALDWQPPDLEFLFVDNASTDSTAKLIPDHICGHPVRKLHEPRPGKSFALNTGIRHATGTFIVFIDDDVRPAPDWLAQFDRAAAAHAETDVFCGQIRPDFEITAPEWMTHLCDLGLSFGATALDLNTGIQPIKFFNAKGANLMVRASSFGRIMFDEGQFNFSAAASGGEDTFVVKQLTDGRSPPLFVPGACLYHWISSAEMSLNNIETRYQKIGFTAERRRWLGQTDTARARQKVLRGHVRLKRSFQFKKLMAKLRGDANRSAELSVRIAMLSGRTEYLKSL